MAEKHSPPLGIMSLSELLINVKKSWSGHGIADLGAPVNPNDAARLVDAAAYDPFARRCFHDMGGTVWQAQTSGSGSIPVNRLANIWLNTGATSMSYASILALPYIEAEKNPEFEWAIRTGPDLDNAESIVAVHAGIMTFWGYTHTRNRIAFHIVNGTLYAVNANGSAYTATNLGSVSGNAMYQLRAKLTAGVKCEFYTNGSLVATHTTNLPTGEMDTVRAFIRNAAAVDRSLYILAINGFLDY